MPLFTRERNELANYIGRDALRFWLHTAAPTDADPTNGRTTVGGGGYEAGIEVAATNISDASGGSIEVDVAIDFGTADEDVGTVTHLSAVRGTDAVGYWTIPSTTINNGDSFEVNADTVDFNITST